MKLVLVLLTLALSGCAATPVARNFPEVPTELNTACPNLKKIESGTTKLSDVVSTVSSNYGLYQECQIKSDAWIEWYKTQKSIFDSVK
jgi:hypothetical protein